MDTFVIVMVAILPSITAAVVGWILREKVNNVHLSVNSRLDELLKAASALARAEGLAEGRAEKGEKQP